jgi:hypothetical protein
MKVNPTNMLKAHDELLAIFEKKNSDYGNSFEESLEKHGLIAAIVRMEDKMGRLNSLTKAGSKQKVSDESLVDTLKDLSNYALMTAVWLEEEKAFHDRPAQPPLSEWDELIPNGSNLKSIIVDLMKDLPDIFTVKHLTLDDCEKPKSVFFVVKDEDKFRKWSISYIDKHPGYDATYRSLNEKLTQVQVFSYTE